MDVRMAVIETHDTFCDLRGDVSTMLEWYKRVSRRKRETATVRNPPLPFPGKSWQWILYVGAPEHLAGLFFLAGLTVGLIFVEMRSCETGVWSWAASCPRPNLVAEGGLGKKGERENIKQQQRRPLLVRRRKRGVLM